MTTRRRLAFIGFGEAAQAMASGLKDEAGTASLSAFDVRFGDPEHGPDLRERARALGVAAAASTREAVSGAEIVLSLVTGSAALRVAEQAAPHLAAGQTFVDLTSVSPETKRRVGDTLARVGARGDYVEGAIMDAVRQRRHKVPILLAGPSADRAADRLNALGMRCEVAGAAIGQACAVKMIRSVMVKGVEALILESMGAARRAGVTERILSSVDETFAGLDWRKLSSHYLRRTHEHGPRRATEMEESAATLRGLGMEAALSTAIAETIRAAHTRLSTVPYDPTAEYPALLDVLAERNGAKR